MKPLQAINIINNFIEQQNFKGGITLGDLDNTRAAFEVLHRCAITITETEQKMKMEKEKETIINETVK